MKFGSNKQNNQEINVSKVTVLSLGFELKGDVISKNDIRADGNLQGNIRTDKKVVVGEKASIIGDIMADEISISGEVVGDLYINGETTIYPTAKVSGNILTNHIFIHKGAKLNTSIKTDSPENIQKEKDSSKLQTVELENTFSLIKDRQDEKDQELEVDVVKKTGLEIERKKETAATNEPVNKRFHRSW